MYRRTIRVWLIIVVALLGLSSQSHAQDAVVVTVANGTGSPAGRLVVSFAGSGGVLTVDPLTVFAPGCPTPTVGSGGGIVTIDWGLDCVASGGSISFLAVTSNGPLSVIGGSWFGTGGAPLLGPIDGTPLTMYGTDNSTLFTIDPATATTAPIGSVGAFGVVADIDCAETCVMYGGTGMGDGDLVIIDQTSGVETFVGNNGVVGESNGALEWVGPTLYAVISGPAASPSTFVTLDPITGAATTIGLTGVGPIGGLAYDPRTGIMYGSESGATGTGNLVRIDLGTGAATVIGPTGYFAISALDFHPTTSVLYGAVGTTDPSSGTLVTIDIGTGAATAVGPTSYISVSGITFCGGKLAVQRIGPGGILLPNGIRIVWRQRIRYQPIGLIYGFWSKPPGQCWTRWCCFIGQVCRRDLNLYVYKTFFGRVFGMRRCIPVVRGQFFGLRGAGWQQQRRTQPPPPDQPQIPIGGPPPNRPPIPGLINFAISDAFGASDQLTFSDDGGETYRPGTTMSQTFGAMGNDIIPFVPGAGAPPPLVLNFIPTMQQLGPGFCAAANRLAPLINELQLTHDNEPDPWIMQVKVEIEILQLNLVSVCGHMNSGAPIFDPAPYFGAANANANLAALMLAVPLPGDATPDVAQRLANASVHFQRCALGWQTAGEQVAANMFNGSNDILERDTFYWHLIQHYPSELAMLSAALDRHVHLRVSLDGPTGWGFEVIEPVQIEIISLELVGLSPIPVGYEMPVSHNGDIYIRRPDRADGNVDADELFRVRVKFPTMLSDVVDVAPGDGLTITLPPMILGDADGDDCITPNDLQLVNDNFGQGGEFAPAVPSADVNFDGFVNGLDQQIVLNNMGLCGQSINDCNGNGMDDTIDLLNGDLTDCNGNSIPDECEVAAGIAPDGNNNGVPDECDCPADIASSGGPTPDGDVNVFDLFALLSAWNTNGPGANLAPPNHVVNVFDLFVLLSAWGPCK